MFAVSKANVIRLGEVSNDLANVVEVDCRGKFELSTVADLSDDKIKNRDAEGPAQINPARGHLRGNADKLHGTVEADGLAFTQGAVREEVLRNISSGRTREETDGLHLVSAVFEIQVALDDLTFEFRQLTLGGLRLLLLLIVADGCILIVFAVLFIFIIIDFLDVLHSSDVEGSVFFRIALWKKIVVGLDLFS